MSRAGRLPQRARSQRSSTYGSTLFAPRSICLVRLYARPANFRAHTAASIGLRHAAKAWRFPFQIGTHVQCGTVGAPRGDTDVARCATIASVATLKNARSARASYERKMCAPRVVCHMCRPSLKQPRTALQIWRVSPRMSRTGCPNPRARRADRAMHASLHTYTRASRTMLRTSRVIPQASRTTPRLSRDHLGNAYRVRAVKCCAVHRRVCGRRAQRRAHTYRHTPYRLRRAAIRAALQMSRARHKVSRTRPPMSRTQPQLSRTAVFLSLRPLPTLLISRSKCFARRKTYVTRLYKRPATSPTCTAQAIGPRREGTRSPRQNAHCTLIAFPQK